MSATDEEAADLEPGLEKKAEEEQSLDAKTTHEVIRREGVRELGRSPSALAWSGLGAGLTMGFSFVGEALLHAGMPATTWRPLVAKLGYSFGFLMVILGSQQLFTENTLTPVVPYLAARTREKFKLMVRLWGVVLLTNVIGTILFAWALAHLEVFSPEVRHSLHSIATEALAPRPAAIFVRGIFAGWLIAMLVWMLPAGDPNKVLVIVIMTWIIGAAGLAHIIAGSVEASYLVWLGDRGAGDAFVNWFLPTLAGNMLGGIGLVALLNHKQATSGK
ncbi:MAG TPA: formate/nitrite transporter family protein [Gemmatimonadaceae bacterium]|nr:formate/nitrite transporter family protein [Gemmatimonadaceae bacterium]